MKVPRLHFQGHGYIYPVVTVNCIHNYHETQRRIIRTTSAGSDYFYICKKTRTIKCGAGERRSRGLDRANPSVSSPFRRTIKRLIPFGISLFTLQYQNSIAAAGFCFCYHDLLVDFFFQISHMGNDAYKPVAFCQIGQCPVSLFQRFRIKGSEAFILKQRVDMNSGGHLHLIRKT